MSYNHAERKLVRHVDKIQIQFGFYFSLIPFSLTHSSPRTFFNAMRITPIKVENILAAT